MSERGCCTMCDGYGRDASAPETGGRCWDCRGTGHPHSPSPCRTACPSKDHATFGECVRAARIEIDRTALASGRND